MDSMDDIIFSGTMLLAAMIRARHVSAVEVLEAHLTQIEKHNPALNAIIALDAEHAFERARSADKALARGEAWGPLHGVPFTLKDSHSTEGMRTTAGCLALADNMPREDGTVAARLKAAGGILIGKTNVSTLLLDIQSSNPIFGRTNNPWNIERTAGGSSGGAAAALASGMTPFEIGSDTGGSIRLPSHFCGVFGLKPTENRVSQAGHVFSSPDALRSFRLTASIGPMARSVEDLALLYPIIAGPDGHDIEVQPVPVEDVPELELRDLRVAFAPTFPGFPVAVGVRKALEDLVNQLNPLCALVEEAVLPKVDFHHQLLNARELTGMIVEASQSEEHESPFSLAQYLEALQRRDQFVLAWERFFESWDVLLCPTSLMTAFPHCEMGSSLQVDDQEVEYWMANAHCKLFNYTGHPAVVLPCRLSEDGLPIGVQLVGKRWAESHLLAVAKSVSQVTGKFQRPPGY